MLNNNDKKRLRAEEIYRDEIRHELENERTRSRGVLIWKLLNSTFFI